ncbi:Outer membrane protein IcsA autotransporter precursor [Variovorax sp. PBL-H6]|nr:Outer membrane protein IcsA autotransporter precursor [Variovorax sp. PBL-H6]
MGGAIFVVEGGSLTLSGSTEVSGNSVVGGIKGSSVAQDGSAFGAGIFMQGNGTLAFAPAAGATQTMADVIADQTGSGGTPSNAGSVGLIKRGGGRLVLSAENTYSGGTTVTGGTLSISSNRNLGSALTLAPLTLDGGTLQGTASFTMARDIHIGSGGAGIQTDGDLSSDGDISGTGGVTKTGAGLLILNGNNTYLGGTRLVEGMVSVSRDANLGEAAGGLVLDGGTLRTVGDLTTNRATTLGGGTISTSGSLTHRGAIGGPGPLIKEGFGNLVLTGANTYGGGTIVALGTLSISADQNLGQLSTPLTVASGTLRTTSAFATARRIVVSEATFQTDADLVASGDIEGRNLIKTGTGTLTLAGNNTYTGGTRINEGVVSVSGDANLGVAAGLLFFNGGTLRATGNLTMNRGATVEGQGGTIDTLAGTVVTQGGSIGGSGGLVKTGAGTLTLTATNSYGGGTTLDAGTLAGSATSFGGGPIANNAALRIDQPVDATFANTVTGSGTLTKTGTGTLTLTGENSYSGGTDLKQGGLAIGNSRALGTGALAMHEDTKLRFAADGLALSNPIAFTDAVDPIVDTGPFTATLAGAITGPGDLSKIGSGTLILSGANSYTGATGVTEGTLRAGAANTFSPGSAHSVASGATLDLDGFSQGIAALTNAGTVSLIGSAPGTTLAVTGPYVGNNGLLRLGTSLGDSASSSDRLVLSGPAAVASGRTTVQVVNFGGLGGLTTGSGIELVSAINGATTTAQSTKDAFALQGGHVDAGAYEYRLQAGDANGAGESWYLRSTSTIIPPPPPPPPPPPRLLRLLRRRPPHRSPRPRRHPRHHRCPRSRRCHHPRPSRCPPTAPKCPSSQHCRSNCARATWPCSATCTSASATTTCARLPAHRPLLPRPLANDGHGAASSAPA